MRKPQERDKRKREETGGTLTALILEQVLRLLLLLLHLMTRARMMS
jgi:hypothetical protein